MKGGCFGNRLSFLKASQLFVYWRVHINTKMMKISHRILYLFALGFIISCNHSSMPPKSQATTITSLPSGTNHVLFGVYFIDVNTGFVVGDSGTILKTINSGSTWSSVSYPTNYALTGVYFLNIDTGFVCGDGLLLKTTNSGNSWTKVDSFFAVAKTIQFFGLQNGVIIGTMGGNNSHVPYVMKTTNSASSWYSIAPSLGNGRICISDCGSFYDASNGFLGMAGTPLNISSAYRTTNGGISWDSVYNTSLGVTGIHCVSSSVVYMCSDSGLIVKSTDFGTSWLTQSSGTSQRLYAIFFASTSIGYTIGANGTIISTSNGGTNWSSLTSGTTEFLSALYFPTTTVGFIVGTKGTILKVTS
jgi:photosystem II stability/assembly factor-like uncharacterized protein